MQRTLKSLFSSASTLLIFLCTASVLSAQAVFDGKQVLIILKKAERLPQTRLIIESNGGHIVHLFPPRLLHAYVTEKVKAELDSFEAVDLITDRTVDPHELNGLNSTEIFGLREWNNLFVNTVELLENRIQKNPDHIPAPLQQTAKYPVHRKVQKDNSLTSKYLIGSVSVGIIFVESNGMRDLKTETWTTEDKEDMVDQIYKGLDWWSQMGGYRAHLSWSYDIQLCATEYEPISRTKEESVLWIQECMSQLGYSQGEDFERTRAYAHDLKNKYKTDWSFIIFVAPARQDTDGYFADKSGIAWACIGGPYIVIPNKCNSWGYHNVWKVLAHETGHIFNALDEYESIDPLLSVAMSNVTSQPEKENHTNTVCMMKSNDLFLCDRTRVQIGWTDQDHDGIYDFDPVKFTSPYLHEKIIRESLSPVLSKMIFHENFSRQHEWFEDPNNYTRNGTYVMFDSVYGSSSWLERDYYDFIASVKTQWIQGSVASGYGLMVRVKTATDGYIFFINEHGQFSFGKYVNSNWKYLSPWAYSDAIRIAGENILKVECIGNRFTLFINDEQVAEVFDDTFIYGNVGLAVLPEVQVSFDDLTILAP